METDNKGTPDSYMEALSRALDALPAACRKAFRLVRFEGKTCAEAAATMGLTAEQVRQYVVRALVYVLDKAGPPPDGMPHGQAVNQLGVQILNAPENPKRISV